MTTFELLDTVVLPDEVARQIVLPEGHRDEAKLYEAYRWIRENQPMGQARVEGYDPVWLVSKHADVMEVERQPHIFSAGGGEDHGANNPILNNIAGDEFTKTLTGGHLRILDALPYMDPPEHSVVKDIAMDWFRPANMKKWEERIRASAKESVARLIAGDGTLDFATEFSTFYPLHVMMTLFGVPEEDEPRMMALTQEFFGSSDPDERREDVEDLSPEAAAQQFSAAITDFYAYFDAIVEDRRAHPRDDLATIIATAKQEDGTYFPKTFSYGWFIAISTAGHDTTASTLSGTILELSRQPETLARVQQDPSLIGILVNEGLRISSPVKHFVRYALSDYEIRGQKIKKGDRLMVLFQSANRDSEVFDDPDRFDINRRPNKQLAFGYGPHQCIGQHLAKLEMKVMLEELLPHLEAIEVVGDIKVIQTNFVGGIKNLPVKLTFK